LSYQGGCIRQMKNYQRILFSVLSTAIMITVLLTFKTTNIELQKEIGTTNSNEWVIMEEDTTPLEGNADVEYRDVEDDAERKQEIVTEVKSEY